MIHAMSAGMLASLFALTASTALSGCALMTPARKQVRDYAVRQRWNLDPASYWDYLDLDPVRRRLYITRGEWVEVLDPDNGHNIGQIPATPGVHGVTFAQDLKLGFTSNGKSNSVTVFDLNTLRVRREVPAGGMNPDAILYDATTQKLYTFNGASADVSVFEAASMRRLATIPVGGKPEFAAADGVGRIFVNIEDKAEIVVLDAGADKVHARWPLAGCEAPSGLAFDAVGKRLFSVCANRVMAVTDSTSGREVARIAIGAGPDAAVYDADSATVFVSNGDGTLSLVRQRDPDHYDAAVTIATRKGARTMAFDHSTGRIYLPAAEGQKLGMLVVGPLAIP